MFAYKAGVFNTLVRQQYIAKMKYLQSRHFNNEKNLEVFNQRFAFIQNSSDTYLTTIQRLVSFRLELLFKTLDSISLRRDNNFML